MTAVLIILSLLVFSAGLVAWAVHMCGVWANEAGRTRRRRSAGRRSPVAEPPPAAAAGRAEIDGSDIKDVCA